jgi:hypothetical protein
MLLNDSKHQHWDIGLFPDHTKSSYLHGILGSKLWMTYKRYMYQLSSFLMTFECKIDVLIIMMYSTIYKYFFMFPGVILCSTVTVHVLSSGKYWQLPCYLILNKNILLQVEKIIYLYSDYLTDNHYHIQVLFYVSRCNILVYICEDIHVNNLILCDLERGQCLSVDVCCHWVTFPSYWWSISS